MREDGGRRREEGGVSEKGALCIDGWQYLRERRDPDPAGMSLAALLHGREGGKLKESKREGGSWKRVGGRICIQLTTFGAQCWFGSGNRQGFPLICLGRLSLPRLPSGGRLARWLEFLCLTGAHNLLHNREGSHIWYLANRFIVVQTCDD